jgi:homoserine kinase type II
VKTVSPGLARRLAVVKELREGRLVELRTAVRGAPQHEFATQGEALVRGLEPALDAVGALLESTASVPLALQWCLRDVRLEHLLFTGDEVSGLVDFGAAAVEAAVGDLARLLGSMVGDDRLAWQAGLAEYQTVRPSSAEELSAVTAFDRGGTAAAAANWLQWLFVERREFPRPELVRRQLTGILGRMPALAAG